MAHPDHLAPERAHVPGERAVGRLSRSVMQRPLNAVEQASSCPSRTGESPCSTGVPRRTASGRDAPQAADIVEGGIGACDRVATPHERVGGVKCIARAKTGPCHQRPRARDHNTVGGKQLERERVHRPPGRREATPYRNHRCLRVCSVGRERILDAVVAQPGEDQPVGELVVNQGADRAAFDRHLREHPAAPVLERPRCL